MTTDEFATRYGWSIRLEMRSMRKWAPKIQETLRDDFAGTFKLILEMSARAALSQPESEPDVLAARYFITTTLDQLKTSLSA